MWDVGSSGNVVFLGLGVFYLFLRGLKLFVKYAVVKLRVLLYELVDWINVRVSEM